MNAQPVRQRGNRALPLLAVLGAVAVGVAAYFFLIRSSGEDSGLAHKPVPADVPLSQDWRLLGIYGGGVSGDAPPILPDNKRAIFGGNDSFVRLWDLDVGREVRARDPDNLSTVKRLRLSQDGSRVLLADTFNLQLVDTGTLDSIKQIPVFSISSVSINSVALSPDGRRALLGDYQGILQLWDLDQGTLVRTLSGHASRINDVAFSPDGRLALTASDDETARLWELETGRELRRLSSGDGSWMIEVEFAPDGRLGVVAGFRGALIVWDMESGQEVRRVPAISGITSMALTSDGERAIVGLIDGDIQVLDLIGGRELRRLRGHREGVYGVSVSQDGKRVLSSDSRSEVHLWNLP